MNGRTRRRRRFGFIYEQTEGISEKIERASDQIWDELEAIGRGNYFHRAPFKQIGIAWAFSRPGKGRRLEPCWTALHKGGTSPPHPPGLTMCLVARWSRVRRMTDAEFARDAR